MANLFIILLFCLCLNSFAQNKTVYSDSTIKPLNLIVKADILLPAISGAYHSAVFSFTVEKLFNKRHSLQLTFASFGNYKSGSSWQSGVISEKNQLTVHSIAIVPEYKFFVSKKKNHTGYYIGASAAYLLQSIKNTLSESIPAGYSFGGVGGPATFYTYYKDNTQSLAVGIINGVQYYVFKNLVIDFIAGVGIAWDVGSGTSFSEFGESSQFAWRLALNVGYRF